MSERCPKCPLANPNMKLPCQGLVTYTGVVCSWNPQTSRRIARTRIEVVGCGVGIVSRMNLTGTTQQMADQEAVRRGRRACERNGPMVVTDIQLKSSCIVGLGQASCSSLYRRDGCAEWLITEENVHKPVSDLPHIR